jgi:carboxyl-terminal processing protease
MIRKFMVVAMLLAGSAGLPPATAAESTGVSAPTGNDMPLALRRQILEQAWTAVNTKYYDPGFNGVDWQSVRTSSMNDLPASQDARSFYRYLNRMLASLKDAHTTAISPQEVALRKARQKTSIGI